MKTLNIKKILFALCTIFFVGAFLFIGQDVPEIGLTIPTLAFALPVCPTDCTASVPDVLFDECNPEINDAQIARVFLTNVGSPLTDWTSAVEWDSRINPGVPGPTDIKVLHVIASKPIPASTEKDLSLGRKIAGKKTHIVPVKIDETNAINHEFLRANECGGNYLMWYETLGGLLFGGNSGIDASLLLDMNIDEASDAIILNEGKFEWKSKFTEERIISPIA